MSEPVRIETELVTWPREFAELHAAAVVGEFIWRMGKSIEVRNLLRKFDVEMRERERALFEGRPA